MRVSRTISSWTVGVLGLALAASACGGDPEPKQASTPTPSIGTPFKAAAALIDTQEGSVIFEVEVAQSREEQERGLMDRESLPANHGMAFVFFEPTTNGFWMKDTKIPLSIAFIGVDGRIQEILDMEPCLKDPCAIYTPADPYDVALEVNKGQFEETGVGVGDKVTLSF